MTIKAQTDPIITKMASELRDSGERAENLTEQDGETPTKEFALACLESYQNRGGKLSPETAISWPAREILKVL